VLAAKGSNQLLAYTLHLALRKELLRFQFPASLIGRITQHAFGGRIKNKQIAIEIGRDNHRPRRVKDALLKLGDMLELALGLLLAMERPETGDAGPDQQNLGSKPARDEPEKPLDVWFGCAHGARQHEYAAQG
jgi:hypothetical protein